MKTIDLKNATKPLTEYAEGAQKETLVITRAGKPLLALIDISGVDPEALALSTNPKFLAIIERGRRRFRDEGGIPLEEIKRKYGLSSPKQNGRKRTTSKRAKLR